MANEALESLQRTLIQTLKRDDYVNTHRVKDEIICIRHKAVFLQLNLKYFLEEETFIFREVANTAAEIIHFLFSPENLSDSGLTDDKLWKQLVELGAELESTAGDVVDYISSSASHEDLTLPMDLAIHISNQFRRLFEKIKSTIYVEDLSTRLAVVDRYVNVPAGVGSSSPSASTTKYVAGFEKDLVSIIDQFVSSLTERQVISIIGMAGIGKSTLARIVYENPMIADHFDIRCWITIAQDSSVENVFFSNLLGSLEIETKQLPRNSWEIYKRLNGMRYLIVMDDVWSTQLWDDIRSAFPINGNGSRILLTTRLMDVAYRWRSSMHVMHFLNEQQSWDLFQREAFADEACPLELQAAAKKIVHGCGGLPLSIVRVAGLLSKIYKSPKLWQQIVANDGSLEQHRH